MQVIAAGDLEQWLEGCPAVALWLAQHLRIAAPTTFEGVESWWAAWAARTRPAMTPDMLLGGREGEIAAAQAWMAGGADLLEVQGDAPDEALAFLRAASTRWPDGLREQFLARCVVTTTEEAFRAAANFGQPLVIAAYADAAQSNAGLALSRGHHVYLAVGRNLAKRGGGIIRLPRLGRLALRQALIEAGLRQEEASGVVEQCGRSIAVLHRRRSVTASVRRPRWASAGRSKALVPALLVGAWSEIVRRTEATPFCPASSPLLDRAVLSGLAGGAEYGLVVAPMTAVAELDDPPLRRAGDVWRLTSPLDAWYLIGDRLERLDLEALGTTAINVFTTSDPKYELPDEEQWMAALHGKEREHSDWLRQGLATSLAVVAHHGDGLELPVPDGTAAVFIQRVIEQIFAGFYTWQQWASLDDVVFLLAEAAPEAVLCAIEDFVAEHPDDVRSLLADGGGNSLTGHCRHAGLLWALERLAWQREYLERCLVLLARLDTLDPGGRWGNRPFATLCGILLGPGDPYTYSDPSACLAALDAVICEASATAWRLFLQASKPLDSRIVRDPPIHLPAKPDGWVAWRDDDRREFWEGFLRRFRDLMGTGDRCQTIDALGHLEFLPEDAQHAVISRLEDRDLQSSLSNGEPIWSAVRGALHRVRSRRGGRALADGVEDGLDRLYEQLTPSDPIGRAAWLFQQHLPQLAEGASDWREYRRVVEARRADAVRSLLGSMDPPALLAWAAALPDARAFGTALADVTDAPRDAALMGPMLSLPSTAQEAAPLLLTAYSHRKLRDLDRAWFDRWLATAAARPEPAPALAALHCVLPNTSETWRLVEALGSDAENLYWRWAWAIPEDEADPQDHAYALERLLSVGRTTTALMVVCRPDAPVFPGPLLLRLARLLMAALNDGGAGQLPNILWDVGRLFEQIDCAPDLDRGEVAMIEWLYLMLLVHTDRGPRILHAQLASSPALFAQVIRLQYTRRDHSAEAEFDELTHEARAARAREAGELLSSWTSPLPGESPAGFDTAALAEWVVQARRLCAETDRAAVGDLAIGRLLAQSPVDSNDGAWPHGAVRQVLAVERSEDLDRGFHSGVLNKRGTTSRGMLDGGAQEREEADRYAAWAATIRRGFPHAARLLIRIADDYREQAVRQDEHAAKNDLE